MTRISHLVAAILFCSLLVTGLVIYDDYGMSLDTPTQINHGLVTGKYLFKTFYSPEAMPAIYNDLPELHNYRNRYYGTLFQLPFIALEASESFSSVELILYRHLLTFLIFFGSLVYFYRVAAERFSGWIALLGTAVLIATPRIFAESFYNIKDVNGLSLYLIAACSGIGFLERRSYLSAAVFALASAVALNIRINTVFVPALVILIFALGAIKLRRREDIGVLFLFSVLAAALTIAFYPASWSHPVMFFWDSFQVFANYKSWNGTVIYFGNLVSGRDLPWHYLPVWIAITTPTVYSIYIVAGAACILVRLSGSSGSPYADTGLNRDVYFLTLGVVPLFIIIAIGSNLYGGWRHLYFVYPSLVWCLMVFLETAAAKGFSTRSASAPSEKKGANYWVYIAPTVVLALIVEIFATLFWMGRNHPHQYMYFNPAARPHVADNFDRDYWAVSAKQAVQALLEIDKSATVKLAPAFHWVVVGLLSDQEQKRIRLVGFENADYYIEFYRNKTGDPKLGREIYAIKVDDFTIASVQRLE